MAQTQKYEIDLAPDIYEHLRIWWGLKAPELTDTKCRMLARSVSKWRTSFRKGKYKAVQRMYQSDQQLAGYLTAFGPRYAYTLYHLLKATGKKQKICEQGATLRVCYVGGGAAVDMVGLLAYLYERNTAPRDLQVHFVDQSPQWRRFHNALFGSIIPKYFRKTRALPHYHDFDLSAPAPNLTPSMASIFESSLVVLPNVLSEFSEEDRAPLAEHLWHLLRGMRTTFYLAMADSNARKLRPRLSWIKDFVPELGFRHSVQLDNEYEISCPWLSGKHPTTAKIFSPGGPSFLNSVKRRGFGRKGNRG